jgi:hypothetical protein
MTRVLGLRTENAAVDGEVMEDGPGDEDALQLVGIVSNDDELSQSINLRCRVPTNTSIHEGFW